MSKAYSIPVQEMEKYMKRKKYASKTINMYLSIIVRLIEYSNKDVYHITQKDVNSYIDHVLVNNGNRFINLVVSAAKIFLMHGLNKSETSFNKIERPRIENRLPVILSVSEVEKMIETANFIKHKAIICTQYFHGLRRSEVLNLKFSEIDRARMELNILQSKGNNDRKVPLNENVLILLEKYYRQCKPKIYVFEGLKGGKYSETSMQNVIKNTAKKAGIRKNVSTHTLRHSFAVHQLEAGNDIRYIQKLLGHKDIKTTMIYTQITELKVKDIGIKCFV